MEGGGGPRLEPIQALIRMNNNKVNVSFNPSFNN